MHPARRRREKIPGKKKTGERTHRCPPTRKRGGKNRGTGLPELKKKGGKEREKKKRGGSRGQKKRKNSLAGEGAPSTRGEEKKKRRAWLLRGRRGRKEETHTFFRIGEGCCRSGPKGQLQRKSGKKKKKGRLDRQRRKSATSGRKRKEDR